jgi:hypothetical protein
MGGIATLTYDSGGGGTGANSVDNIVPTAWEEIDYGFATGISDVGAVSASKGVINLTVKAPVAGTGFSISYASGMSAGHIADGGTGGSDGYKGIDAVIDFVDYSGAHAGFRWGIAAQMELPEVICFRDVGPDGERPTSCNGGLKNNPYAGTMYSKLHLGPIHFGTQATFKDLATSSESAVMNQRSIIGGIAAVFGDTLSLSYGVGYDTYRYNDRNRGFIVSGCDGYGAYDARERKSADFDESRSHVCGGDAHEYITQKYEGWSAALNMGPVALKGTSNHVNSGEVTGIYENGDRHNEINLSIAF